MSASRGGYEHAHTRTLAARLAAWWAQQRRAGALPGLVGGFVLVAILLPLVSLTHRKTTSHPQLPAKIVARLESVAAERTHRAASAVEELARELDRAPAEAREAQAREHERVEKDVVTRLAEVGARIDQAIERAGAEREAVRRGVWDAVDLFDPRLRRDLRALVARLGKQDDWDRRLPELKGFWHGRAERRANAPAGLERPTVPVCVALILVSSDDDDTLASAIAELVKDVAKRIAKLLSQTLERLAEADDDETGGEGESGGGADRRLVRIGDRVLEALAEIEGEVLARLPEIAGEFGATLDEAKAIFAAQAAATPAVGQLAALKVALAAKLAAATTTQAKASLTNAIRGIDQVAALLAGSFSDLPIEKLRQIIELAREVTGELREIIEESNERLDKVDEQRAEGKPAAKVDARLGKAADRIVEDVAELESDIARETAEIAADPVPLALVQAEFRRQTKLLAPLVEANAVGLIGRLLAELGIVADEAVRQKVKNAILALRGLLRFFDVTPVAITFSQPVANAILAGIPTVTFETTDAGSGPNPTSAQLKAVNTGPIAFETTDLTGFLAITLNDQVQGRVVAQASGMPAGALQDGFLRLEATATDNAGNPPTTTTRNVVLDREAPLISVTSPGATVPTTASLSARISDAVSGVDKASIRIDLDGVNITSTVMLTQGPPNPLGAPNVVDATASLALAAGPHTLRILARDVAQNERVLLISFVAAAGDEETVIAGDLRIEILSGDNQSGLAGRASQNMLRARVFDADTGAGIEGVGVLITLVEGGGAVVADETLLTTSRSDGTVEAGFIFGPSTSKVAVSFTDEIPRVTFTLNGILPALKIEAAPSIGEGPNNALIGLFQLRAEDPSGNPISGEIVEAWEAGLGGTVITDPAAQLGYFVPEAGITDANGRVRFAYVGRQSMPTNVDIAFTFRLPNFRDAGNKPVSAEASANSGQSLFPFPVQNSGQGQVGRPNFGTMTPLKIKVTPPPDPPGLIMIAVFGTAPGVPGETPQDVGGVEPALGTEIACIQVDGKKVATFIQGVATPDGDQEAACVFIPGQEGLAGFPALVKVGITFVLPPVPPGECFITTTDPIPTTQADIFAIGPPELWLVRKSFKRDANGNVLLNSAGKPQVNLDSSGNELFERIADPDRYVREEMLVPTMAGFEPPTEQRRFFIEQRLAPLESVAADVEVKSLNLRRTDLSSSNAIALTTRTLSVEKKVQSGDIEARRSTFRTKPIVMTAGASVSGAASPIISIPPEPVEVMQGSRAGFSTAKAMYAGAELQSGKQEQVPQRVIVLAIDGLKESWINEQIGELTAIRRIWGKAAERAGYLFGPSGNFEGNPRMHTCYPAVTYSAFASLTTGRLPGEHRFLGSEVFIRSGFAPKFKLNLKTIKELLPGLLQAVDLNQYLDAKQKERFADALFGDPTRGADVVPLLLEVVPEVAAGLKDYSEVRRRHFAFLAETFSRPMDQLLPHTDTLVPRVLELDGDSPTIYKGLSNTKRKTAVVTNFIAPEGVPWYRSRNPGSKDFTEADLKVLTTLIDAGTLARGIQDPNIDSTAAIAAKALEEARTLDDQARLAAKNFFTDASNGHLPEFALIHFAGLDHAIHWVNAGNQAALDTEGKKYVKEELDKRIREILDAVPGQFKASTAFLLTADHGAYLVKRRNAISLKEFTASIERRPAPTAEDPWVTADSGMTFRFSPRPPGPSEDVPIVVLNNDMAGQSPTQFKLDPFMEFLANLLFTPAAKAKIAVQKVASIQDAMFEQDRDYHVALTSGGPGINIHIASTIQATGELSWAARPTQGYVREFEQRIFDFFRTQRDRQKIDFILELTSSSPTGYLVVTQNPDGSLVRAAPAGHPKLAKFERFQDFTRFFTLDAVTAAKPFARAPDLIAVPLYGDAREDRFYFAPDAQFAATHGHFVKDHDAQIPFLVGVPDAAENDELSLALRRKVEFRYVIRIGDRSPLPLNISDVRAFVEELLGIK